MFPSDVQQLLVIKEEVSSEWSPSLDQKNPEPRHIKEEQEELWTIQEGEQLHEMKEDIITRFQFTAVTVKSEYDEEKPQSSLLLQSQTEDNRKTASPASSSATPIKTETNREGCGGSEPVRNRDPVSHPQANTDEKASDCQETDDWQEPLSDSESESGSQKREKTFVCEDCGKRFTLKKYLTLHIRIHTGEKPFGCDICGKRFNQLTHLKTHLTIHTGDKPFVCVDCGKSFSLKKNFNRHMRIHTGDTLCCDVCGNRFQCQAHLTTHMIVHTGEKPFECGDCGKTFSLKKNLDRHMRVHTGETPFSCDVCGNIFQCQAHLVAHLRVHTGERPFGCVDCGKRFSLKKNLDRHMRVHSVDKPFGCDVCGKQYKDPSSLKTHMKVHS